MANYTMHHLNVGSDTYEIVDEQGRANIAPSFSASTAYSAGDYVIYSGKLYQFTTAHAGAWSGTDAEECTVAEDISQLKEEISHIGGLSEDVKAALLQIARKVAYVDAQGQTYYNTLYNAMYPPADLVSISAVYTQSGTVYDTASLDDLKSDLVVTAHYSDSTTQTVTDYTLSGTLAEGTSTITASFGGQMATFSVTVTHWEPLTATITWSGSGTDKTGTPDIDAREHDVYMTLPFIEGASELASNATRESNAVRVKFLLYNDAEMTDFAGWYWIDTGTVSTTSRTGVSTPLLLFDTETLVAPKGYYVRPFVIKQAAFSSNANCTSYLNKYANELVLE